MNRLQPLADPVEENLSLRLGDLLAEAWTDPLCGGNRPDPHFEAALHFLLGCELAFRFGPASSLGLINGLADREVDRRCVAKIRAVLRPWELCAPEPDFNAVLSLTFAWRQLLAEGLEPGEVVRAAYGVPFEIEGIGRLKGFVGSCLAQFERYGDWCMSGFVKIHRWFDETCPNGPDPRMDTLSVILSAPYSASPVERSFISAVLASRPKTSGIAQCRDFGEFILEVYDWAVTFPERFPEPHARLISETESDPEGPGMGTLVRLYRHWFEPRDPDGWRDGLLKAIGRYVPTVVAGQETLTPWSLEPSAFRSAVDFAAWAGITRAYLER